MLYRSFIEPGAIGRCPIGGYCLLSLDQIPPGVAGSGPAGVGRLWEPYGSPSEASVDASGRRRPDGGRSPAA